MCHSSTLHSKVGRLSVGTRTKSRGEHHVKKKPMGTARLHVHSPLSASRGHTTDAKMQTDASLPSRSPLEGGAGGLAPGREVVLP